MLKSCEVNMFYLYNLQSMRSNFRLAVANANKKDGTQHSFRLEKTALSSEMSIQESDLRNCYPLLLTDSAVRSVSFKTPGMRVWDIESHRVLYNVQGTMKRRSRMLLQLSSRRTWGVSSGWQGETIALFRKDAFCVWCARFRREMNSRRTCKKQIGVRTGGTTILCFVSCSQYALRSWWRVRVGEEDELWSAEALPGSSSSL